MSATLHRHAAGTVEGMYVEVGVSVIAACFAVLPATLMNPARLQRSVTVPMWPNIIT